MPERLDRAAKDAMEAGPRMLSQIGKQLENLQGAICLNPTDNEVTEALGKEAAAVEREAYRQGHQSGWHKGALMFGCAVLAGLAVVTLAISGETKKVVPLRSLAGR